MTMYVKDKDKNNPVLAKQVHQNKVVPISSNFLIFLLHFLTFYVFLNIIRAAKKRVFVVHYDHGIPGQLGVAQ